MAAGAGVEGVPTPVVPGVVAPKREGVEVPAGLVSEGFDGVWAGLAGEPPKTEPDPGRLVEAPNPVEAPPLKIDGFAATPLVLASGEVCMLSLPKAVEFPNGGDLAKG